jgi:hypothetical protein
MKSEVKEKFLTVVEICGSLSDAAEDWCPLVCEVVSLGKMFAGAVVSLYLRVKDREFTCKVQGQSVLTQGSKTAFVARTKGRDFVCIGQGQSVHMQGSRTER